MFFSPRRDLRIHGDDHIQYSDPKFSLFFLDSSIATNDKIIRYKKIFREKVDRESQLLHARLSKIFFTMI